MENELKIQIVQNLVPVLSANIVVGSVSSAKTVFGDTMTGTGTPTDPVNVSGDILSQISNNTQSIQDSASQIADIESVIPSTASSQNQLADQGFVNSSIQTATAYFRGDWSTWADVPSDPSLYPADATGNRTPITNDYMVVIADEQENGGTWRYKYTGVWSEQGKSGWMPEYQVNETPFTAAQNAAINSGVTAQAVADIAAMKTGKQDKLTAGTGITIDGNTISASGGGGDYLPLAGGEMSGPIAFSGTDSSIQYDASKYGLVIYTNPYRGFVFSSSGYGTFFSTSSRPDLGKDTNKWERVYARSINNGANLNVPTEGGTLARLEDLEGLGGGDYLPLSGGTMAGDIFMAANGQSNTYNIKFANPAYPNNSNYYYRLGRDAAGNDSGFGLRVNHDSNHMRYFFTLTSFCALPNQSSAKPDLGNTAKPWKTIYVTKMNNGADLAVPTEGGTLARIEDIDAVVGDISTALTAILGE